MDLEFFSNEAIFVQTVKVVSNQTFDLKGTIEYQSCNDETCTMDDHEFVFKISGADIPVADIKKTVIPSEESNIHHGLWWFFNLQFCCRIGCHSYSMCFPNDPHDGFIFYE